jgi:hypothetical protein
MSCDALDANGKEYQKINPLRVVSRVRTCRVCHSTSFEIDLGSGASCQSIRQCRHCFATGAAIVSAEGQGADASGEKGQPR